MATMDSKYICLLYTSPSPRDFRILSDGEYVSGQRTVPSVRAQCDALGDGKKSAQHKEKLRLPDVA